jgi:hypothetical protein
MSTSQSEDFEGLLHMKRGKFNESVNALERALRAIYWSPKKVFDRLRADEKFANRMAGFMASGGYTKDFGDLLSFFIDKYEEGRRPWKRLRKCLLNAGFMFWPDEEAGLVSQDEYQDRFVPIVDRCVAVELISFRNIPERFGFSGDLRAQEIIILLNSYGLRPLTALELWALAVEHPKVCLERTIVALGSYRDLGEGSKVFPALSAGYKKGAYHPCTDSVSDGQQLFNHYSFAAVSRFIK